MAPVEEKRATFAEQISAGIAPKNVLFATDFSATSEAALPYATAICRHFGATLHAVHVISDTSLLMMTGGVDYVSIGTLYDDAHAEAKDKLENVAHRFEGLPHRTYIRHGQVWSNLAIIADQNAIDLIVVGTHGRTGLGKLLLGSVAEDILRHAPCPVLTVGPRVSGRDKLPFETGHDVAPVELEMRSILFATNFAESSRLVAQAAVFLAEDFRSRLTLLHVMEDYTSLGRDPKPVEAAARHLKELIPPDAALQYAPEPVLEFGPAWQRILKVASDREADLIVIGARAAEPGSTHLPWSTTHHVIAHAHCPVLTMKT